VSHADRNKADPSSERILLQVDQPQSNHNAGDIVFGPDGYLYIPLGDGGRANDVGLGHPPLGNGQDISTLLGSILRIDVDGEEPYGIPGDNPFVGREGRDEIYAYGFRNPYRISFDVGGQREFWVSDVGQNRWEEVNLVDKGGNYGWNLKEGTYCFDPESPGNPPTTCADVGPRGESLIDPVIEFANSSSPGGGISRAVVGGYVYRGSTMPQYIGRYIFGGWSESFNAPSGILLMARRSSISGQIWTIDELQVTAGITQPVFVLSFGYDPADELYVLTSRMAGPSGNTGAIYKLVSPGEDRLLVSVWDQEIISDTVTIAEVISDGPGWMVIHAEAQGGGPGPVIGYAPLTDGRNLFVTVNIDKSGATGTLYAMPHVDVGIIGAYEFPGADVPVRVNGQVLTKPFKALNMEPLVEVMDQEVVEGTVTLPRAVMKGPGWMVIHAEAPGGGPGPVIGHTAISDGLNISVKVPIDVSNATQTLYAMLHYDRGTMGVYEFPGADVPVQVDGRIAMAPFNLIVSQGTVAVDMINLAFRPKVVIIRAGSTVRWTNREALPHTATDDGGAWDSSTMDQGDIFSRQFGTAGVYRYHCRFHGASDGVGMAGTVVVFP
ncbi:MAG: PQQ-dependent sugar dehydrogenase, partial [Chloroflexi bacterium]|nr:PQQ-dependent sugar dehydrogenase [Chloroflexota bacterium]